MVKEARLITFEQARAIVQAAYDVEWPVEADFTTSPSGAENADVYVVVAGPYARLYGARNETEQQWEEPVLDDYIITVNKQTGEIVEELHGELSGLTPCGEPEPE